MKPAGPFLRDQVERGADQRLPQVAVVIAAPLRAAVVLGPAHVRMSYMSRGGGAAGIVGASTLGNALTSFINARPIRCGFAPSLQCGVSGAEAGSVFRLLQLSDGFLGKLQAAEPGMNLRGRFSGHLLPDQLGRLGEVLDDDGGRGRLRRGRVKRMVMSMARFPTGVASS